MQIHHHLIEKIRNANSITVLTGAGISKESGIPTFREAQTGLWAKYDPAELASPQAFLSDPKLVWEWYQWRRELIRNALPNPAHFALAKMEKLLPNLCLVTQNVDGLHRTAGSQNIVEIHGNIMLTKCFDNQHPIDQWSETGTTPPLCPICGSNLRPDVVWFGENLPAEAIEKASFASRNAEVFFSIGTSAIVHPAASLPMIALQSNAILVEINPDKTPISDYASYTFRGAAGEILPSLVKKVWDGSSK